MTSRAPGYACVVQNTTSQMLCFCMDGDTVSCDGITAQSPGVSGSCLLGGTDSSCTQTSTDWCANGIC